MVHKSEQTLTLEYRELENRVRIIDQFDTPVFLTWTPSIFSLIQEQENRLQECSENLRLGTELKKSEQEKRELQVEVERLKGELANFDDDFFDEIEDLKYNYAESVKKNVMYEEHLRSISQQFGVAIDLPSSDS